MIKNSRTTNWYFILIPLISQEENDDDIPDEAFIFDPNEVDDDEEDEEIPDLAEEAEKELKDAPDMEDMFVPPKRTIGWLG